MKYMYTKLPIVQVTVETGSAPPLRGIRAILVLFMGLAQLAACSGSAVPEATDNETRAGDLIIERDVSVPMRDGVILRANIYRPAATGEFPVLVYRTPYGKDAAAESYATHIDAVARGYAVVLQDVRGRHASDGLFDPYRNEGKDGYDTIEWAAAQSWSNNVVGTWGLSYPGAVQWLAALESPPHLVAMVPAMTFSSPRNFFYMNGIFDLSWLPWIYMNIAPDARHRLDLPGIRSSEEAADTWSSVAAEYRSWLPLAGLPHLRNEAPYYFEWLRHPPEDSWWDWAEVRGRYGRVAAAVLNLSGWYDEAYGPEGAVTNFNGLRKAQKSGEQRGNHLLLGPWTHGVDATMSTQAGELDFGASAAIDYNDEVLDFFDHYLRGIENRYASDDPVRYFVMGENRWHGTDQWPPAGAEFASLYLGRAGNGLLRLAEAPESADAPASSSFTADPDDPVLDPYAAFGPHDYGSLAEREDLLIFDSEPLTRKLRVAGAIEAVVYASCDCRDFDLWVRVFDVYPDGRVINLMSPGNDVLRASYRQPEAGRQLIEPGRIYALRLQNLLTGNLFAPGHRIRLQVSASFAPHFSRNLQTGESEGTESASQRATISIHHGPEYPSAMRLPIVNLQP
ncbi:MAG: CocE/NonD family hydrolase [Xanthomonadales bacterium]|nr:CocE/NonD family hydrolase [Xanthomonadales bacterium]